MTTNNFIEHVRSVCTDELIADLEERCGRISDIWSDMSGAELSVDLVARMLAMSLITIRNPSPEVADDLIRLWNVAHVARNREPNAAPAPLSISVMAVNINDLVDFYSDHFFGRRCTLVVERGSSSETFQIGTEFRSREDLFHILKCLGFVPELTGKFFMPDTHANYFNRFILKE